MKSPYASLVLLPFLLFASTTESRTEPGAYWRSVMKDQPMPEAIHKLIPSYSAPKHSSVKTDCHDDLKTTKSSTKNFEGKFDVSVIYRDDKATPDATIIYRDDKATPDATIIYRDDIAAPDATIIYRDDKATPDATIIYRDDKATPDATIIYRDDMAAPDATIIYRDDKAAPDVTATYNGDVGPNDQGKKPSTAPRPKISVSNAHEGSTDKYTEMLLPFKPSMLKSIGFLPVRF